ncbi:hypothetical protein RF11_13182 [Thelohanellus kitauei]|uniref:Uncharacterized protein n=1 Tax=Thelohanellus kitauei TaxID=669202 RepID=A0A0C2N3L3_THEKT|nr:hypothetical protein RF11_13182 [Thelohanellus kitauei]
MNCRSSARKDSYTLSKRTKPSIEKPFLQEITTREVYHQDSLRYGSSIVPKDKSMGNNPRRRNGQSLFDEEILNFRGSKGVSYYIFLFMALLAYILRSNPSSVAFGFLVFQKTASAFFIPPALSQMSMGLLPSIYPLTVDPLDTYRYSLVMSYPIVNRMSSTLPSILSTRLLDRSLYGTRHPSLEILLGDPGHTNLQEKFLQTPPQTQMVNTLISQGSPGMSKANVSPLNQYFGIYDRFSQSSSQFQGSNPSQNLYQQNPFSNTQTLQSQSPNFGQQTQSYPPGSMNQQMTQPQPPNFSQSMQGYPPGPMNQWTGQPQPPNYGQPMQGYPPGPMNQWTGQPQPPNYGQPMQGYPLGPMSQLTGQPQPPNYGQPMQGYPPGPINQQMAQPQPPNYGQLIHGYPPGPMNGQMLPR